MTNCLIIEDEIASQELLISKIKINFPQIRIKGVIDNVSDAILFLKTHEIELVFIDNQIKGGKGLDIIKSFTKPKFSVIYCTAYSEYAIEALNYDALYYLLKPYTTSEFNIAVNKFFLNSNKEKNSDYIILYNNSIKNKINYQDILYIKSEGSYTTFFLESMKKIITSKNIGNYSTILPEKIFVRVHHSTIVNINKIKSYNLGIKPYLILFNDVELNISKRKLKQFKKAILI